MSDNLGTSTEWLPQFGRYETERVIGRGAFGTVYQACDPVLDSSVAIKVLADNYSADPETRERFINEARVLRRVGTERLVSVHDIGEERGQPYFVMELASGGTLANRLAERSLPLELEDLQHLINEMHAAIRTVHDARVIHRDIKPSNLLIQGDRQTGGASLLAPGERLVLGDFGLARDMDATGLTVAGGTDGFMAPEQQEVGATVDERADIYAATAVLKVASLHSCLLYTSDAADE